MEQERKRKDDVILCVTRAEPVSLRSCKEDAAIA